jgi:hypothetical protein
MSQISRGRCQCWERRRFCVFQIRIDSGRNSDFRRLQVRIFETLSSRLGRSGPHASRFRVQVSLRSLRSNDFRFRKRIRSRFGPKKFSVCSTVWRRLCLQKHLIQKNQNSFDSFLLFGHKIVRQSKYLNYILTTTYWKTLLSLKSNSFE